MSATKYYECRVTMEGDPETIKPAVENLKWKFSAIDGDPTLGDGVKCYATHHFNSRIPLDVVIQMVNAAGTHLRDRGVIVMREKVEHVVYDSRLTRWQVAPGTRWSNRVTGEDRNSDLRQPPGHGGRLTIRLLF